ncbi:MAG TPA: FAD-dependent monooxygenase [Gemmatimonadaceae bacterium]
MRDGDKSTAKTEHSVIIAGGGPTGLMLAAELALAGVDVAIVERRVNQDVVGSRASGLHSRTIEILDQRGIAERFVSQGQKYSVVHFAFHTLPLDITDFPSRHNYVLGISQKHIERILAAWVDELTVPIYRGRDVTGFAQDDEGVDVAISDGTSLRAEYFVGCDGGRSVIRKAAGIDFPGWDATTSWIIAEVRWTEEPPWGFHVDAAGRRHAMAKGEEADQLRVVLVEPQVNGDAEPTLRDVTETLITGYGTDYGAHSPTWISRFTDMTRQAASYRDRRVLLAGDAAHVHPPFSGQGLNLGVQDAMNLGWKLAQVVKRISPDTLLDSYHAERHPVDARTLRNTMAQGAARRPDEGSKALGEYVVEFLKMDGPRKLVAGEVSALGIHYDLGEGPPLLGRRVPDLDLITADGTVRVFSLLHDARAVLINFGAVGRIDIAPWADRVQLIDAAYHGTWELPVIGAVASPSAVLVRPDGYVAWVGTEASTQPGLTDALTRWFGAPAAAKEFHGANYKILL